MNVFINDRKIEIFRGALVMDAVRFYSGRSWKHVESGSLIILDRFGNRTESDGELTEGQKLYIKKNRHV